MADENIAKLESIVATRIAQNAEQIRNSIAQIAAGNPLGAEPSDERRTNRLQRKTDASRQQAEMTSAGIAATARLVARGGSEGLAATDGREAVWGSTLDFVGVSFLQRGRRAADAVGRVAFRDGRPNGTGFLVAPGLFLTNNHVIPDVIAAARNCVEFNYETGPDGHTLPVSRFAFDPERCFVADSVDGLDFTLIGVGARIAGQQELAAFGHIPLSDAGDKHMLGEVANIVQHPQGRLKEIVLRENQLLGRDELAHVLHYIADTEPGASGSPVFNNEWEAIALHHWGGPWLEGRNATGANREINEGIRVSAIVAFLRNSVDRLPASTKSTVLAALALWKEAPRGGEASTVRPNPESKRIPEMSAIGPRLGADGNVTWTIPLEISLRIPGMPSAAPPASALPVAAGTGPAPAAGGEARRNREDFSDRAGYESGFLPGVIVPLPRLSTAHEPARLLSVAAGDDPHELRYHHFSVVMNARRRLAYFTACNIDGSSIKAVDRSTKSVTDDPTLSQLGVESTGAEASDAFRPDPRIDAGHQMAREFYADQNVPGFPDRQSKERIARMFQKGHLTLRGDPAWGPDAMAVAAERDTFFYTNAAPQLGFFNQGSALNRPGSKGKLRWRAVETYVLRNAVVMRSRVTVFAGPVFSDGDPEYRFGSLLPMRFWKIAVWIEGGEARSIALIADQSKVLEVMPEGAASPEAFLDPDELARIAEFATTVREIEALTGLDFGSVVRNGDVRADGGTMSVAAAGDDGELLRPKRRTAPRKPRRTRRSSGG